ncbi:hypothetical protein Thermo_01616 [Thermoplasmatales archaeon]|nr:hypothetical protein Thermo_01616 [Thermoplasmatales archaeon]
MKEVVFTPSVSVYPSCGTGLKAYRTDRGMVKSCSGQFVEVHRLKICMKDRNVFSFEILKGYIRPHRTYADEVTLRSTMQRFIDG